MSIIFFPLSLMFHEIWSFFARFFDSKKISPQEEQENNQIIPLEDDQNNNNQDSQNSTPDTENHNTNNTATTTSTTEEIPPSLRMGIGNYSNPTSNNHQRNFHSGGSNQPNPHSQLNLRFKFEATGGSYDHSSRHEHFRRESKEKVNCGARLKELRRCLEYGVWTPNTAKTNYRY
ncbi:13172_t:CDS:2 [Ambispora leptoticha]|uniref:13172_t:CDS:1 n=1 Tax=Ambispora leptoticha TaxID=144679 RepID=A0A9N8ZKZ8_9GLOM|nr:13172_t:CDS:2 [Ambispora leptoticha]